MVYDFLKILKKCLKYWYVFVATLVLSIGSLLIFVRPIMAFKTSCNISISSVNKNQVLIDTGDIDYYDALVNSVTETTKEFYVQDNLEEINKKFQTDGKLKLKLVIDGIGNLKMYKIQVMHPNKSVAKEVLEYVKVDLVHYVSEVAQQEVPVEYQTVNSFKIYNEKEPSKSLQDEVVNFGLVSIAVIIVEIIIVGVLTLKNNKIEFEEELQTEFKVNSLVKNYNKNKEQVVNIIKTYNLENAILICEDVDYAKNLFQDSVNEIKNYKTIKDIQDLEIEQHKNVVLEIVKGETQKSDVEKITKELNKINFKNYYFITRVKEKKNESSSSK